MSGISGPAVYSCPWCGRFVEQGESCWCKQSREAAMTRQEIRAALKEARAENARLEAERVRLQARVRELEESSDEEVIRSQYATRRAVERAVAAERERDRLREALESVLPDEIGRNGGPLIQGE